MIRGPTGMELGRHRTRDQVDLRDDVVTISMQKLRWHLIAGEYALACGGVAGLQTRDPGVYVHPLPDGYRSGALRWLAHELNWLPGPKRILVQYVPYAVRHAAMNVPFWPPSLSGEAELTPSADNFVDDVEAVLADPSRAANLRESGRSLYAPSFSAGPHHESATWRRRHPQELKSGRQWTRKT
jgi:hypothetical protein